MTEAPNLEQILSIVPATTGDQQVGETLDSWLDGVLSRLLACVPAAHEACVWRLSGGLVSLWATTGAVHPDINRPTLLETHPALADAARSASPLADADNHRWLTPLRGSGHPLGVLEITFGPDQHEFPAPPGWLAATVDHLALSLENQINQAITRRRIQTSIELTVSTTFRDIASVIARNMLSSGQFVSISRFKEDSAGAFAGFETFATANRRKSYETEESFDLTPDDFGRFNTILQSATPVLSPTVANDPTLGETFRNTLLELRAQGLAMLPMWSRGRAAGFIAIINTTGPLYLTETELSVYQSLADQVSAMTQAQYLMEETKAAQSLAEQLIEVTRSISLADSYAAIAQAVIEAMPDIITLVAVRLFDRPLNRDEIPASVSVQVMATRSGIEESDIVDKPDPHNSALRPLLTKLHGGELIVIRDLSQYTPVMSSTGFMDYQDRGVRSLATVGLRSGSHLLGLLNFGAEEALPETGRQNENFQAIASQVAIAIENRNLLQSARRQAEQMQRTVTFGQAIQASLEPATIYETLLRESANLIDFDDLHIMIFDHEKGELQIVARNDGVQMSTLLESDLAVGTEGTTAGHVWENQTLLHLTDLMQETELQHPYRKDIHALMAAPFRSRGMMRGVIEVGSTIQNTYSDTDVAVFQHMVSQLAVALENAEAYAQSQQLAKNKALAGEISSQLQQQTDINSILNIAVSELGTVLGARRGRIRLGIHAPDRTDP